MIEKQDFDDRLQNIDEVVGAPDVRELVRNNRLEMRRREAGKRAERKDDRGPEPPDDRRHVDERGIQQLHGSRHAEAGGDPPYRFGQLARRDAAGPSSNSYDTPPPEQQVRREKDHAT